MLAVCQKWRYVGLPIVYRQLFVSSDPFDNQETKITSNIGLCASQGYQRWAKSLKIRLATVSLDKMLKHTGQLLAAAGASQWPSIVSLQLGMAPQYALAMEDEGAGALGSQVCKELAAWFAELLPGIARLSTRMCEGDAACAQFVEQLQRQVVQQLVHVDGGFDAAGSCQLSGLQTLSASFGAAYYSARGFINAGSLRHLRLYDTLPATLWTSFYSKSSSPFVSFDNLATLSLSPCSSFDCFDEFGELDKLPANANVFQKLQFPGLQCLKLGVGAHERGLVAGAQFPGRLAKLHVHSADGAELVAFNVRFGLAERQQLAQCMGAAEHGDFGPLASFMLGAGLRPSYSSLTVYYDVELPSMRAWPRLSRLRILGQVTAEQAWQLAASLNVSRQQNTLVECNDRQTTICAKS
ncbi:hypothetical protein LPJ63_000741 [Coemansia sp. RSA 2711]|nr:hypothetical protein LPJ63_000741 [Coemansia sp. RSA 2711]